MVDIRSRRFVLLARSAGAFFTLLTSFTTSAWAAEGDSLETVLVTAQRRAESIQDVPIAVNAFDESALQNQRLDDASDLQLAVPNLTYTGGNEGFQIRGVGDAVGGSTGDVGVGIHHNNAPQVASRIASGEFYDVERIEVLRGPQGTLYGRNATGGVINVITAKPNSDELSLSAQAEVANFDTRKLRGHLNVPLGDAFAFRVAGSMLQRDGYTRNLATGNDIDDRDLWSGRATLGFQSERFRSWLLYERFKEDDSRRDGARSLCISDPGPTQVGNTPVTNATARLYLSRGCLPGSIYTPAALGHPNSVGTFGGRFALLAGVVPGNVYAGQTQSNDLRVTSEYFDPNLEVTHDIVEWQAEFDITSALTLSLLAHRSEDESLSSFGDYQASIGFLDTPITPGGVFNDLQGGPGTGVRTLTIADNETEQTSVELRLQSAFEGPLNFSIGALGLDVDVRNILFVSTNATTAYVTRVTCGGNINGCPIYFDRNNPPDYSGHQYFVTDTPYELTSRAAFGEVYWQFANDVKVTAGVRYTDDTKKRTNLEVQLLAPDGANGIGSGGYPANDIRRDEVGFEEVTGRFVVDWKPSFSFTDDSLFYASFSRGYKAGGFNSPEQGVSTIVPYKPEFINAFELGTKNVIGRSQMNLTAFYYDYKDYQISKVEQFSSRNDNVDAQVMGIELETTSELADGFIVGANLTWLDTEIKNGRTVDPLDRNLGDPNFIVLRTFQAGCIAPVAQIEPLVAAINAGTAPPTALFNPCAGRASGLEADLAGNELPHSPKFSATVSAQYGMAMGSDWEATLRGFYSWKDDYYSSVFNGESYELRSWDNASVTLTFGRVDRTLELQLFGRNLLDDDTIVSYATGSDGLGLRRNLTLLEPRLFGLAVTYRL